MNRAKYIDPIIGTVGDEQATSIHGGGKTHPGACYPFGMVQLSPDTVTGGDNGSGYNYCQNTIEGFSFNHMSGIGWYGDLGNLQIMPVVGEVDMRSGTNREVSFSGGTLGWRSEFSHEKEHAEAGYYSVMLDRYGIFCEATVSCRTGMLRFTYPEGEQGAIIFNFSRRIAGRSTAQHVRIDGNVIEGCIECDHSCGGFGRGYGHVDYKIYFRLEISGRVASAQFFENEKYFDNDLAEAAGDDLHLKVLLESENTVVLKCGISYESLDGARANLLTESKDFDFDLMRKNALAAWENALACAEVEGSDKTDKKLFYTCLYHTLLDPRIHADEGDTREYIHRTMFSGWDVYRSQFPLLTLISPATVNDEVNSLLSIATEKNSSFPRWELMGCDSRCMTGDPGTIVMADAYLKGICDFDIEAAYAIAIASARSADTLNDKPFLNFHPASREYREQAYVANGLSHTLEFLMADYALMKLAEALGKTEDAAFLQKRVESYKNNFDMSTGFMGSRDENGNFIVTRGEYDTVGCIESNVFQQSWFVPYDIDGLFELFGKERAEALLDRLFAGADLSALWNENYNHSNEPCHNLTHYFTLLGRAEKTQYWTRRVQKEAYRTGAFGFCGNEDVGQLSAWYVLSAIGLAQICMADEKYYFNTPLFKRVKLKLDEKYHSRKISDTLIIECDHDPLEYPYIESVCLNGERIDREYITYSEISAGGVLEFKLKN